MVFRLNTNGSGFTVLHTFWNYDGLNAIVRGRDGALYGTTSGGGTNGAGTVFKLNTDGTGYNEMQRIILQEEPDRPFNTAEHLARPAAQCRRPEPGRE